MISKGEVVALGCATLFIFAKVHIRQLKLVHHAQLRNQRLTFTGPLCNKARAA